MKNIKNIILEELTRLTERDYKAPPEILDTLKDKLKMDPLIRYVDSLKAVNSIPPSYEVRLLNGQFFEIYYESFSLMVKVGPKEYYVLDMEERSEAIEDINRLLTKRPVTPFAAPEVEAGEEEEGGATGGGATGGGASTPPPAGGGDSDVAMEPDEEEPEGETEEPEEPDTTG
tara:strand:- start:183 stop:701 length:519 start_codon:yes stop_codon:yes gene_type:complete